MRTTLLSCLILMLTACSGTSKVQPDDSPDDDNASPAQMIRNTFLNTGNDERETTDRPAPGAAGSSGRMSASNAGQGPARPSP